MNVYEIVTERILDELAKGRIPWRRPWRTEGPAINYVTRRPYSGINRLLLSGGEYLTYKQIEERGGKVKKGEKSSIVVFWKQLEKEDEESGETRKIPILRYYRVFSIHQCEGIDTKLAGVVRKDIEPIQEAEKVFAAYTSRENIEVKHTDPNRAYYQPDSDFINLPELAQYDCAEEYYSTAFHEATHSTGHTKRLNRIKREAAFGSASYSKEELVAEIGAAYICESCGLDADKTITNSAAYIQSWSAKLKEEPRMIVLAAGAAEKATELILGNDDTEKGPDDNKPGPGPESTEEHTASDAPETAAEAIAAITGQPVSKTKGMKRKEFYIYVLKNGKKVVNAVKGYYASELHEIEGICVDKRQEGHYYFTDIKSGASIKAYFGVYSFKDAIRAFNEDEINGKDLYTLIHEIRQTDSYRSMVISFQKAVADAEKKRIAA